MSKSEINNDHTVELSIVVPVMNEEDNIEPFLQATTPHCESITQQYEIIIVNDGSSDHTLQHLLLLRDTYHHLKVINLSRNFGKEIALTAGLDHAQGNVIIPMDVDLQDPPSLIPQLYSKYQEGFDTVLAVRQKRNGDNRSKRFFANSFYRVFKRLSDIEIFENAGDFRLISRRVLDVINDMPERTRFMKGLLSWPGFNTTTIYYDRPERAVGDTKWSFSKLWGLALDGIFSFSTLPLKVWTYMGFTLAFSAVLYMFFTVIKTIILGVDVPGYASIMSTILLIGGVNLMGIGILGEYISRIFIEVKNRPMYAIERLVESVVVSQHDKNDD